MKVESELLVQKLKLAKSCPNCGSNSKMSVDPNIYNLVSIHVDGDTCNNQDKTVLPVIIATCNECGHTLHFSAKVLGLLP